MSTQIVLSWKRLIPNTFVVYRYSHGSDTDGIFISHIDKVETHQLVLTDKISYSSGHPALDNIKLSFKYVSKSESIWRNGSHPTSFELLGVFSNIFEASRYVYDNLPEELI
ncbi:hypothetical protein WCWAEYFT_CDS0300 [Vibrio phage VB_VaC_TDDLMA]